eukprot:UN01286
MQHCASETECNFFFHITSTSGCILYNSCDETRTPAYSGTTVSVANLNVVYYQTELTCFNGDQKISQPCNGGAGTGCVFGSCVQHCFDEDDCKFSFTSLKLPDASFTTAVMKLELLLTLALLLKSSVKNLTGELSHWLIMV